MNSALRVFIHFNLTPNLYFLKEEYKLYNLDTSYEKKIDNFKT